MARTGFDDEDMRLELDDPSAARDLVSYLNARPDCVAAETGRGVVEVNLLGSQRLPFMRLELDLRLGAWRAANPRVGVVLVTG